MDNKDRTLQQDEKIKELELQNHILSIQQEQSLDGILVVDSNWNMVSYNQRFVDMWSIAPHILKTKDDRASIQSILDKLRHPKQFLAKVEYLMAHPTKNSQEILELKNGCFFDRSSLPIISKDNSLNGRIWFFRDITQKTKQDAERLETARQKEQLKKFESLRTMAGAIAHRFNNAMMTVQGNLDLMLHTLPVDSNEFKMASDAAQAAKGASQVASTMLNYVGQSTPLLHEVSLPALAKECVNAMQALLQPSISVQFKPPEKPLYCSLDQKQIKEVIASTLTNAMESQCDDPGVIEITFGTDFFRASSFPIPFQSNTLHDGLYAFCQIKDSGHGISEKDLSRIFEPFYTTRFVGRGLGLAMTVGIMQAHHGALTIESDSSTGTTVRILLPLIQSPRQAIISSDILQSEAVHLSGNILLADDDEMILKVGRKMLELLGFTVHTVINGLEAVDMIRRQDVDFVAAVLDISMPEMDGINAMEAIKEINPALPILLSSGYPEDDLPFQAGKENKSDGFLKKPFELAGIRRSLERLLS